MPKNRVKHVTRRRQLSREEALGYRIIREQIEQEKPEIKARHEARRRSSPSPPVPERRGDLRRAKVPRMDVADGEQ